MDGAGLHYVVAFASNKKPIAAGWLDSCAPAAHVEAARSEPYFLLGHIPGRVGLLVVDIDTGKKEPVSYWRDAVRDSLGAPVSESRSGRGGLHLYYRCDRPVGNRIWEGGEIRCSAGYATLWDEDAVLAALENLEDAAPVDVSAWPIARVAAKRRPARARPGQTARVQSALRFLRCCDLEYDSWLACGMALHHGEHYGAVQDGLGLWTRWSAKDKERYRVGECAAKWHTFDPDGGRTLGTFFRIAKLHGWRETELPKPKPRADTWAHPDLTRRQFETHSIMSAIAKDRGGKRTVTVLHQTLADQHGCSRRTVIRDMAHLQAKGFIRTVGRKVVREADGGFVVPVYRPVDPELEQWLQLARDRAQPPEWSGGVGDIGPLYQVVSPGRCRLVGRAQPAPPAEVPRAPP